MVLSNRRIPSQGKPPRELAVVGGRDAARDGASGGDDLERVFSHRVVQMGDHQFELPDGVSTADWALERNRAQNPRLRAYLGCIRLLEEIFESNYSILHCSPGRLLKTWRRVRRVCVLMRAELAPTLAEPSLIPALELARRNAEYSFRILSITVIADLERYPHRIPNDQLPAVRKLLCMSIGKIYAFLRDTFAEVVANDPRSPYDADYYLSTRFPSDIEEAEWLYGTADRLNDYLVMLNRLAARHLTPLAKRLTEEQMIPSRSAWVEVEGLLDLLMTGLAPRLREVLALRDVRFDELEPFDNYAFEIPHNCKALSEVYAMGRETIERLKQVEGGSLDERRKRVHDLLACHAVVSAHMGEILGRIDTCIRDLSAYVPLWMKNLEKRRALMLSKLPRSERGRRSGPEGDPGAD